MLCSLFQPTFHFAPIFLRQTSTCNMTMFASTSGSLGNSLGRTGSPGRLRLREEDTSIFGYESPPDTPALTREVFKWVQGLDLSHALKNVRRDTANGFLVAEIFSRYFPADIQMHGFANGVSSHSKKDNWVQLQRFSERQGLNFPSDLVEGTMTGVHGAAVALLEHLYELFTGKKVKRMSAIVASELPAAGLGALGGANAADKDKDTAKTISSQLTAAANLGFGEVQTRAVGDAADLRRKLAGAAASQY